MTRERNATSSVFLSFLVVLAALGGGVVATTGGVAAEHGSPGNYTVHLPDQQDHQPGDENGASASIWHLAGLTDSFEDTSSKKGFEQADFLTIGSDDVDFSQCGTSNTAAFGIDREDDDSGTRTDQDLLQHRKDSQFNPDGIVVEFFDEDDLGGSPVSINAVDQIVAVQNDCYEMPEEPGWYQITGSLNGTGYDGSEFEIQLSSHYFYVCDCGSEQEARETLGPPPSESSGSESTPEPEATATPEPEATATATDTPTPTPAQGESTPTATPASSGDDSTATATPQQNDGQQQQIDGQQQQQQQRQQQQQQQQATATAAGDAAVPVTPTVAEGPGFGAGLAIVALAGAALVAVRRSQ